MTMRSVASAPVGAPLAMSTLGAGARSLRAPAMPSITGRPCTGSKAPGWLTGPDTGRGRDQVAVGHEAILGVPRQRANGPCLRSAAGIVPGGVRAVARGQAGVGWLGPGRAAVERE